MRTTDQADMVVARPSNAQSARNFRLFTPGFAPAISTSVMHLAAFRFRQSSKLVRLDIHMAQQDDASCLLSSLHCLPDYSQADPTRHLEYSTSEEICPITCNIHRFGMDRGTISGAKVAPNSRNPGRQTNTKIIKHHITFIPPPLKVCHILILERKDCCSMPS